MRVERTTIALYPEDRLRLERLARMLAIGNRQPNSGLIRMALAVLEIVVDQNNGLPENIREELFEGADG